MNRWITILILLIVAAALAGILITRMQVWAAPPQPIAFSHLTHVQAGVQCLFCHSSPLRADIASLPSVQKCMGCHAMVATDKPEVQVLAGYWERKEPIPWNRVNYQPEFVYFSHRAHLASGLNCEICHGDVGSMTVAQPVVKMDMGWCLDCHLKQPPEKTARLSDCLTCHK